MNQNHAPAAAATPASKSIGEGVMSVVTPHVKRGRHSEFADAVREAERSLGQIDGFRGLRLIEPQDDGEPHVIVFHFADAEGLARWEASEARRGHLQQIDVFTERPSRERKLTGLEFWFHTGTPDAAAPPRLKMAIVTIAVIYPTSMGLTEALGPVTDTLPAWLSGLFLTVIMVMLLTYAIMPLTVRLLRRWLF